MSYPDRYGFPKRQRQRVKTYAHEGTRFATGDLIQAKVGAGKVQGVQTGRVTIRQRPSFRLHGLDVHPKQCRILQRNDGYDYSFGKEAAHSPAT